MSRLRALAYHGVPDRGAFESQVRFLARNLHPVSGEQVVQAIRGDGALPPRAVLVTFDDGDPSLVSTAAPILARWGVPAVAFVVTGVLESVQPLWWQEVRLLVERGARARELESVPLDHYVTTLKRFPDEERKRIIGTMRAAVPGPAPAVPQLTAADLGALVGAGFEIGNHTHTHPILDRCDDDTVAREIGSAHEILCEVLGAAPRLFAYPNGNWDSRAARSLQRYDYDAAFVFDHRVARMPIRDPFRVSRLRIDADAPFGRFAAIVSGVHSSLFHLLRRG